MGKQISSKLCGVFPAEILEMLGPAPLLATENPVTYQKMLERVAADLQPTDIIGWILVRRFVDQFFELTRYRRLLSAFMQLACDDSVRDKIAEIVKQRKSENFALGKLLVRTPTWEPLSPRQQEELAEMEAREAKQKAELEEDIQQAKAAMSERDFVQTFSKRINEHEQMYQLVCAAEDRLSATRDEIDRHRNGLGRKLQESCNQIIEGEFVERSDPEPTLRSQGPLGISTLANKALLGKSVPKSAGRSRALEASQARQGSEQSA